ncbi:MAG: TRC40/GET3/ArsA family transport-energizing ATPase [Syntrophomonas sp.]
MSKFMFFSGKGGTGKTTMAATTAVYNARLGKKTLIVSTDPASNLGDIFERPIGHQIIEIADNLFAMEIDPDQAAAEFREGVIGPMRGIFPEDILQVMEEQFRSSCTTEIAAFDRFTDFLNNEEYDLVVFDTAPTGHTVRLLELPVDWSKYMEESKNNKSQAKLGPVSAIQGAKEKYDKAIAVLRNADTTEFYFVLRPEKTSIFETERAQNELKALSIDNFKLIINGIIPEEEAATEQYAKIAAMQQKYLDDIKQKYSYPTIRVYMQGGEIKGLANFNKMAGIIFEGMQEQVISEYADIKPFTGFDSAQSFKELLARKNDHRIVIFTGKGGVGKTVTACATAVHLAKEGHKTLLVTTDPAAHIAYVLDDEVGNEIQEVKSVARLFAARIDQKVVVVDYKAGIIANARKSGYSNDMITAIKEELESPCTEEMAVFEVFSTLISSDSFDYVVFDTAPTGHTLRLLELPYDYAKQVEMLVNIKNDNSQETSEAKEKLQKLVAKIKDQDSCTFLLVFYPEYTPIFESKRTYDDLKEAGINIQGVIANNILSLQGESSEFHRSRCAMQQHYLHIAKEQFNIPMFKIKMFDEEIIGLARLMQIEKELFG